MYVAIVVCVSCVAEIYSFLASTHVCSSISYNHQFNGGEYFTTEIVLAMVFEM